jgi:putative membrane protein
MRARILLSAGVALIALQVSPVWAQTLGGPGQSSPTLPPAAQPAPPQTAQPAGAPARDTTVPLTAADRDFVMKAAMGGLAEIQSGQLAQTQAKAEAVKSFGQQMASDHADAGQKLKTIADAAGISTPTDLDSAEKKQQAALEKLHGPAFDKRYVQEQLTAHKQTVALFRKEADSGSYPQLKQFASETLPILEQHLNEVETLAAKT